MLHEKEVTEHGTENTRDGTGGTQVAAGRGGSRQSVRVAT